jgi:CheY-like chemotaxis protein
MTTKTILLIEDHRDSREVYGAMLRYSGYRVVEAKDGGEGVRLAQEHRPDVILMDLQLPLVDGWRATEVLKADPETAHIPVIAVSAHAHQWDRERAIAAGCDGFLAKPYEPSRLVQEIQRILP